MTSADGARPPAGRTPLDEEAAARIRRRGPIPFAEVMDLALYDLAHGFYATGGAAGRRGDFLTSPEVGPLFGAVVARALDTWWDEAGRPDPFVVVEAAAGSGMLARTVLAAAPACAAGLTYVLVEQSEALRSGHGEHLPLVAPELAFPPEDDPDDPDRRRPELPTGPRVVSLGDLPAFACADVVLANELLDNLPVVLLEVTDAAAGVEPEQRWSEVRVGLGPDDADLVEVLVPAPPALAVRADRFAPAAAPGARIPLADAAADWLRTALDATREGGRVVVVDYADRTPSLAGRPPGEWLRTYREHDRGGAPVEALGAQDITCEVPIDQLDAVVAIGRDDDQATFLVRHGIDELVAEGRRVWHERAHIGDLAAIRARSRIREAEALVDPEGLGAFRVLEWRRG